MFTTSVKRRHAVNAVFAALAIGGLAVAVVAGVSIKSRSDSFSDLKTLYSSAWCFARGLNSYSIPNLQSVFTHQGMTQPVDWFGKYPVYPPTTLALLTPLTFLPITDAVYLILFLSVLAFIGAVASLLNCSFDGSDFTWGWKAILVTVCASGPLLAFALILGNLSVLATALGILAFMPWRTRFLWIPASSLALAIVAKPHLGVWFAVAMLLLQKNQRRNIAGRAFCLVGSFTALVAIVSVANGTLMMQVGGFLSVLKAEAGAGSSMNISSREVLPVVAQITSLPSLIGFWTNSELVVWLITLATLGFAGWWLIHMTRRARTEAEALLATGAWIAFGLLGTYHRAHDAIALLILLPFLLHLLRQNRRDWRPWTIGCLYLTMSVGPSTDLVRHEIVRLPEHSLWAFLMLRQVSIAATALWLELLYVLRSEYLRHNRAVLSTGTTFSPAGSLARSSFAQPMVQDGSPGLRVSNSTGNACLKVGI